MQALTGSMKRWEWRSLCMTPPWPPRSQLSCYAHGVVQEGPFSTPEVKKWPLGERIGKRGQL